MIVLTENLTRFRKSKSISLAILLSLLVACGGSETVKSAEDIDLGTEPEVTEPTEPEVTEPEVTAPEVTEPEVTEPEVTEPEVTEPEVTEPEVTEPEVTEPEVTEPEVTEPEVTEPEVTEPEVTEPATSGPAYIKNLLSTAGVFSTPSYTVTTAFDDVVAEYEDNIKGLLINGLDYNGNPTTFFSWYGVPENLAEGEKAPAVVLVHGGGGTAFANWVNEWTSRGYIAIAIAHEGQIPGDKVDGQYQTTEQPGPTRAGFFRDADEVVGDQWFYHAVADAMLANSLLRSFPEVDTNNIGINGISWGGILTNVITGIDDRFKFSVPVYGCGYLYESPKYSVDMAINDQAELDFYYANWEPSLYIPLQDLPVFYVNGTNDKQFALNIATPSYNLIPSEKYLRVELNMKHSTTAGYAPQEIYHFADYITQAGSSPLTVTIDSVTGSDIVASHEGSIQSATLYYTTDPADWSQDGYSWQAVEIALTANSNVLNTTVPDDAQYFFINVTSTDDYMYSSPMESLITEVTVEVKAEASHNYGIDTVATLYSTVQTAPDGLATYKVSVDITPTTGTAIISGVSGGTSTVNSWAVGDGTSATNDDLFNGDAGEWVDSIANIQIIDFNANGGLLNASDIIADFQGVTIVNAHSTNDGVSFQSGETLVEYGKLPTSTESVDLETMLALRDISTFSVGVSNEQAKNKWSVESISVNLIFR